jgi:hypothetical protein
MSQATVAPQQPTAAVTTGPECGGHQGGIRLRCPVVHHARHEGDVRLGRSRVHGCRQRDVAVAGGTAPTTMQRTAAGKLATYDRLLEVEGCYLTSLQPTPHAWS